MTSRGNSVSPTRRATVRHLAQRGVYDRAVINAILDEALICHVGIVNDGQPVVIPMLHVRVDDRLYIHGSPTSRLIRLLGQGAPACVTVTLLDGLVLARSAMHHSLNYRSVMIFGSGRELSDRTAKLAVLEALVEHVLPGRWNDARPPAEGEIEATALVGFRLDECSAKVRSGPPVDDEADYALPVWAGVVPLAVQPGEPQPDPRLAAGIDVPHCVSAYLRRPRTR